MEVAGTQGVNFTAQSGATSSDAAKKNPGDDLLSRLVDRYHRRVMLNGRVRDGNGCFQDAMVTGKIFYSNIEVNRKLISGFRRTCREKTWVSAVRHISTGQLSAFMYSRLHFRPIDLLFLKVPYSLEGKRMVNLGVGFPLRCFQRLSLPDIATQRCP